MKRQQTWQERRQEQQLHEDHRRKKFHARQTDRIRPAAWQHSCREIVGGHLRRQLDRINAFNAVVQDQLAAVGETLEIGMNRNRQLIRSTRSIPVMSTESANGFDEEYIFDAAEAQQKSFSIT